MKFKRYGNRARVVLLVFGLGGRQMIFTHFFFFFHFFSLCYFLSISDLAHSAGYINKFQVSSVIFVVLLLFLEGK